MTKTIIWLCENTLVLKGLHLDIYFPECNYHAREIIKIIPSLLGKSFCTHSETIINYIGCMIDAGKVDNTSIEINIIEDWKSEIPKIRHSTYDENGYLINWSLGFFDLETVE